MGKDIWRKFFRGRLDSKIGQLRYIKNAVISKVSVHPRAPEEPDDPVTEDMDETTVADEPEDEHTDAPEDIEGPAVIEEEPVVDEEEDIPINEEPEETVILDETDQIEIEEEKVDEAEVQSTL